MAKRRKPRKKSSKCPELFNTLIDIAGAVAMNAIANKTEKKYQYSQKGKINPYKVSAFKIGTGSFKSTKDIVRTGAILGAMGSFDAEAEPNDPAFGQIKHSASIDNRYAWRLNCEDGSAYGIYPQNYETKGEYEKALHTAKTNESVTACDSEVVEKPTQLHTHKNSDTFTVCRVSVLSTGENKYYLADDISLQVGSTITVPYNGSTAQAVVLAVERRNRDNLPKPLDDLEHLKNNS